MRVIVPDAVITGYEERPSKTEGKGNYAIVRFNDSTGRACDLIDRETERFPYYTAFTVGDFICNVFKTEKWGLKFEVVDFKIKGKATVTITPVTA